MKKILIAVLMLMMVGVPVLACECTCGCPTHDPGANLFQPPDDKDAITCPTVCGRVPGSLKYDGESMSVVCPCTGEGFDCAKPKGQKLIPWFLCDCDKFSELENKEKLGVVIEILTPGCKFYSEAGITPESMDIYGFESEKDFCNNNSSNVVSLGYAYDDGDRRTVIVTKASRHLFDHEQLYLGVCLPAIEIDQRIVPINTMVKIRISVYRDKYICGYECGAEVCPCIAPVAFLGCFTCCSVSSYLTCDSNWWNGIAISNLENKNSMVILVFSSINGKQIKVLTLKPLEVRTFLPSQIGVTIDANSSLAIKSTTNTKLVTFGGGEQGIYAVTGEPCYCQ
jgi:hypothetical protein